jgi:ribosomal protein S12 methylthiotransferase accessory factor YcaO
MKVRTLAAARRGTGKAATGQDIYAEAIQEYLERYAAELDDAVTDV